MTENNHSFLTKVMDLLLDAVCVVDPEGRFVYINASCENLFGYTHEELIGRNMIELVHPDDREQTLQTVSEIMQGKPKTHFENRYMRKDGRVVHIMWSARWSESDRLRLAVARDITELKHAERMQHALYRISEAAYVAAGLYALYRQIHRIIGELIPADKFFVARYDGTTDMLSFPYPTDMPEKEDEPRRLPLDTPIGRVIHSGESLLTSSGLAGTKASPRRPDWLGVPLISQGDVIGALVAQSHSGNQHYTNEDKELLQFVSTQVAVVIERKLTETRLQHMAHHDPLTDLPNRTLFYDRLDMALKRACRNNEPLALLCLDLDGFKDINDTLGHQAGDGLLREVAQRLGRCVRDSDTIGRLGGDEFIVLLTNINEPDDAEIVKHKIRAEFSEPYAFGGNLLTLSASIGTAVYPDQGTEPEALLRHADASMYATKQGKLNN